METNDLTIGGVLLAILLAALRYAVRHIELRLLAGIERARRRDRRIRKREDSGRQLAASGDDNSGPRDAVPDFVDDETTDLHAIEVEEIENRRKHRRARGTRPPRRGTHTDKVSK